jgi:hypothetical protein
MRLGAGEERIEVVEGDGVEVHVGSGRGSAGGWASLVKTQKARNAGLVDELVRTLPWRESPRMAVIPAKAGIQGRSS